LLETEADLARLRAQQVSMERELEHQRTVDARLRGENSDLERRLDGENHRNADLGAAIAELDTQIRTREDYIYALRQDAEALRLQGGHLHETNLQA
jgi:chromosome segregation ATPase